MIDSRTPSRSVGTVVQVEARPAVADEHLDAVRRSTSTYTETGAPAVPDGVEHRLAQRLAPGPRRRSSSGASPTTTRSTGDAVAVLDLGDDRRGRAPARVAGAGRVPA